MGEAMASPVLRNRKTRRIIAVNQHAVVVRESIWEISDKVTLS